MWEGGRKERGREEGGGGRQEGGGELQRGDRALGRAWERLLKSQGRDLERSSAFKTLCFISQSAEVARFA